LSTSLLAADHGGDPLYQALLAHTAVTKIITHAQQNAGSIQDAIPLGVADPGGPLGYVWRWAIARPIGEHTSNSVDDLEIVKSVTRT
jgi:hypothetical protein